MSVQSKIVPGGAKIINLKVPAEEEALFARERRGATVPRKNISIS
jgi:hypothetical protein